MRALSTVLLFMQGATHTVPATPTEECNWYCQLIKDAAAPIPTPPPAKPVLLNPAQLANQLAKLSSKNLALTLQKTADLLTIQKPNGNSKTSVFLTGLYNAFDNLTTLLAHVTQSTDLNSISNLKPYLRSRLLRIAGSL